jgi:hypothetical protein
MTGRGGRWPQRGRQDRFLAIQHGLARSRMWPHLDRSCRRLMPVAPTVLCAPTAISAPQCIDQKGDTLSVFLEEIADDG